MMERKKYFVSVASGEISQVQFGNNDDFTIYATDAEVKDLRAKMDVMHNAEIKSFWRAHVPIMPYHHDKANDQYNAGIDRKSTRLNSSHVAISYAVFCLKKQIL